MRNDKKERASLRWDYEPPNSATGDKAALVAMRGDKLELILSGRKATIVGELITQAHTFRSSPHPSGAVEYNCYACKDTGVIKWRDYSNGQGLDIDREDDCDECPTLSASPAMDGGVGEAKKQSISDLVATYRAKLEMENPPEATANELRFAIEALLRVKPEEGTSSLEWKIRRLNDMRHADNATGNNFVPDRTNSAIDSVVDCAALLSANALKGGGDE